MKLIGRRSFILILCYIFLESKNLWSRTFCLPTAPILSIAKSIAPFLNHLNYGTMPHFFFTSLLISSGGVKCAGVCAHSASNTIHMFISVCVFNANFIFLVFKVIFFLFARIFSLLPFPIHAKRQLNFFHSLLKIWFLLFIQFFDFSCMTKKHERSKLYSQENQIYIWFTVKL